MPYENWEIESYSESDALIIYELLIKDNFKIMKDCGLNNDGGCIYDGNYKFLNGTDTVNYANNTELNYYKVLLNDGSTIWFRGSDKVTIDIFYDVNGPKPPNQWGKDLFDLYGIGGKILPSGIPGAIHPFDVECKKTSIGYGCTAWVIYKGNIDYLHCDDLSWDGKQKCGK